MCICANLDINDIGIVLYIYTVGKECTSAFLPAKVMGNVLFPHNLGNGQSLWEYDCGASRCIFTSIQLFSQAEVTALLCNTIFVSDNDILTLKKYLKSVLF